VAVKRYPRFEKSSEALSNLAYEFRVDALEHRE
jgi:hypothetical protein